MSRRLSIKVIPRLQLIRQVDTNIVDALQNLELQEDNAHDVTALELPNFTSRCTELITDFVTTPHAGGLSSQKIR